MRKLIPLLFLLVACGTPTPTPTPDPTPLTISPSTSPVAGDPCHINGVVYCVLNPNVTFATRKSTICVSGWTGTIRPPVSYTDHLKIQQMAAEHLSGTTADYEEDHRLPLTGGGNPTDPLNLSPESRSGQGGVSGSIPASTKDSVETQLGHNLCNASSEQTFHDLQSQFVQTYLTAYPGYK